MASLFQDLIDLKNEALESKTILRPSQLDDLKNKVGVRESLQWFRINIREIRRTPDSIMKENQNFVKRIELGKFYMFYYDAQTKDKLPYYDNFPVVMCLKRYSTGFLGLNFHYISPKYRLFLMQALFGFINENREKPEDTRIRVFYKFVKSISRLRWAKPCIKQYYYGNIDSMVCQIMPEHWSLVTMLPVQKFKGENANTVYKNSARKF